MPEAKPQLALDVGADAHQKLGVGADAYGYQKLSAVVVLATFIAAIIWFGFGDGLNQGWGQLSGQFDSLALAELAAWPTSGARQGDGAKDLEAQYGEWLAGFQAADPAYQQKCTKFLQAGVWPANRDRIGSQYSQDAFLFFNIFKYWPMQGRKGFYVDSGANHATALSNTLFFDKCLGWEGLCVEPQQMYHQSILQHRSCRLVPECISARKEVMEMTGSGESWAQVKVLNGTGTGQRTVQCSPLGDMLALSSNASRTHVDLWSLDVEGFEMTVLEGVDWGNISVSVMLIEDFWLDTRKLDLFMTRHSFYKYHEMAIDAVYVRRGTAVHASDTIWYPASWDKIMARLQVFRKKDWVKEKLRALVDA